MKKSVKLAVSVAGVLAAAATSAAVAQAYLDPHTAYSYVLYADAEKTIVTGYDFDRGCVVVGHEVYAVRVQLHTPYYDATPTYLCTGIGPYLPPDW